MSKAVKKKMNHNEGKNDKVASSINAVLTYLQGGKKSPTLVVNNDFK